MGCLFLFDHEDESPSTSTRQATSEMCREESADIPFLEEGHLTRLLRARLHHQTEGDCKVESDQILALIPLSLDLPAAKAALIFFYSTSVSTFATKNGRGRRQQ